MVNKIKKVMHEFKQGTLHSGSKKGPKVTGRKQAIAIALSEQRDASGGTSPPVAPKKAKPFFAKHPVGRYRM